MQVVNLLVTPEQAEMLSLAMQPDHHPTGAAQPAGHADRQDHAARRWRTIFGVDAGPAEIRQPRPGAAGVAQARRLRRPWWRQEPPQPPFVMEIIQGGKRVQDEIRCPERRPDSDAHRGLRMPAGRAGAVSGRRGGGRPPRAPRTRTASG